MGKRLTLLLVAFLAGIAAHSIWSFTPMPEWLAVLSSVFLVVFSLLSVALRNTYLESRAPGPRLSKCVFLRTPLLLIVQCSMLFILGTLRFDAAIPRPVDGLMPWRNDSASFQGRVRTVRDTAVKAVLVVDVDRVDEQRVTGLGRAVTLHASKKGFIEGDVVSFTCRLRVPGTFPSNIDRRRSLARRGIWHECAGSVVVTAVSAPMWWDISAALSHWRHSLTARIHRVLPSAEAELVAGILYGDQSLDEELRSDVQRAGLMHLVAVSGSNVTIVVVVLSAIVLSLGFSRQQSFVVTSVSLAVFVAFVGASASVTRAACMGWLVLLARELGRRASPSHLLLVTATVLSVLNPWILCFDAGFALSFLAMWGLLSWTPFFEEHLKFLPLFIGIRESAATTLGATLMTTPYVAWAFGRMTLAGLFTNVLALPLVPWTMLWGAVAAAWGMLPFSWLVRLPAQGLAHLIIEIARLSRRVPWLDMHITGLDVWFLIAMYALIWWLWRVLQEREENQTSIFGPVDRSVDEHRLSVDTDKKKRSLANVHVPEM